MTPKRIQALTALGTRIGAGTGIFTRALLAHPDWADAIGELRAVEPSEGMRSVFSKTVLDPRVSVREGTFDTTGIENGWADVVVIAQVRVTPSSALVGVQIVCVVLGHLSQAVHRGCR